MSFGHIKISRKAFDAEVGDDFWHEKRKFSRWEAWVDLIQLAAWKEHERTVNGEVITVPRGHLVASIRFLANRWLWSKDAVSRFLTATATATRTETVRETPIGTLYRIVNYDTYQIGRDSKRDSNRDTERDSNRDKLEAGKSSSSINPPKPPKGGVSDFDEEFNRLWPAYPRRSGGNSRSDALRQFRSRRREGVTFEALSEGFARYAAFCDATGKIGTELVMQASRFLGKGKHWEESWDLPVNGASSPPNPKAVATWKLMLSSGILTAPSATARQEVIDRLVAAGEVKDAEKFLSFIRSLDKPLLAKLSLKGDEQGCIRHIGEKLSHLNEPQLKAAS